VQEQQEQNPPIQTPEEDLKEKLEKEYNILLVYINAVS
jgi:hypothetical protein